MQKPDSNLPPAAQPWRRWVEGTLADQQQQIDALSGLLDRVLSGDGAQAQQFADLKAGDIATLYYQLQQLYISTGITYPPAAAPAAAPPAPVPTYATVVTDATWSESWGSYASAPYSGSPSPYEDSTMLYQGESPGDKIGMWGTVMGAAAGRKITDMQVFAQNVLYNWSSGGIAAFGTHSNASPVQQKPSRQNGFDVSWNEGEGKWVGVPSSLWGGFSNGTFKGFTIGGIGPSSANAAHFMGVGQPHPPRLKITYQIS